MQVGEQIDTDPLKIQQRTRYVELPGGITAALLPKKTRGNAVQMTLNLRYGSQATLQGMHAAMSLLPDMLTRGVKNLSHDEFQQELDKYRATMRTNSGTGLLTVSVNVKRENLAPVLDLVRQAIREPRLDAAEFEVVQREAIAGMEAQQSEPMSLAMRALQRTLSPQPKNDVRYVPTIVEEIERYRDATVEQVQTLHKMLGGVHGEIAIVGDFDIDEVAEELQKAVADWQPGAKYARVPDPANESVPGGEETILTPDKANSFYIAGMALAMKDSDPDYPALVIGNFILGGGSLSSRLGNRVRQQEGLSYTVASHLNSHPVDESTNFMVFAIANPENRDKLMAVIKEELVRLADEGVTDEELTRAKQGYLESQKLSRTQDARLASLLAGNLFVGRDMEYQKGFEQRIAELTVDEVNQVWRKYIDLDRLVVVTAGDFKQ